MDDSSFKSRNVLVLVFEVLLIVIAIGGLTFATSRLIGGSSTSILTFGEYNVDYLGKTEIVANDLEPISDSLINYNTTENVIRLEFSLRGVETNDEENLIYDIMFSDINVDCSLLNEWTKWNLYKNGSLLSSGSLDPKFDGNILTDNMRLTEIQQDLPDYDDEYDNYVLIMWISEACEDLTTCSRVDQSGIVNSSLSMKIFVALSVGGKIQYERVPNMNAICHNKPELYDGMIPVYYDEGEWKIADETNSASSKSWYDYANGRWANVVMVGTDKYDDSSVGTVISPEDALGYYVWIPRFKYKLWNTSNNITDSYNAYKNGIEIVFESGVNSSGTCVNNFCSEKNNEYLTHPAFSDNLRGLWVSKYEISAGNKFVPNVESLKNVSLDSYKKIINDLSMVYNLSETVDSHVISNLEWGAVLYLSHSKYGLCASGSCSSVGINNSYVAGSNKQDTTTRNVYGVYDMAGASGEYALGSYGFGSGTLEVIIKSNETWNNGYFIDSNKDYLVRGGVDSGLWSSFDIGMSDVSTRGVLVSK